MLSKQNLEVQAEANSEIQMDEGPTQTESGEDAVEGLDEAEDLDEAEGPSAGPEIMKNSPHEIFSKVTEEKELKDTSYIDKILKEYAKAAIVIPPSTLSPLYITAEHTDESLKYMSAAYIAAQSDDEWGFEMSLQDAQLYEIPPTAFDCRSSCGFGYRGPEEYKKLVENKEIPNLTHKEKWVHLPDTKDFSCHEGFEKMFVYFGHYARQWPDGTILSQNGWAAYGAAPVWRLISPEHPVTERYGPVESTWIRKSEAKGIKLQMRWQSIEKGALVPGTEMYVNKLCNTENTPLSHKKFDNDIYKNSLIVRDGLKKQLEKDKVVERKEIPKTNFTRGFFSVAPHVRKFLDVTDTENLKKSLQLYS